MGIGWVREALMSDGKSLNPPSVAFIETVFCYKGIVARPGLCLGLFLGDLRVRPVVSQHVHWSRVRHRHDFEQSFGGKSIG